MKVWIVCVVLVAASVVHSTITTDSTTIDKENAIPRSKKGIRTQSDRSHNSDRRFRTLAGFSILSPVSNAQWVRGTTQTIIWDTSVNGVDLVFLEWSTVSTSTWTLITPQAVGNLGRFDWEIPTSVTLSSGYFEVQVRSEDSSYKQSSEYFYMLTEGSVGMSSIISPVSTTTWFPGVPALISWTWVGNIQNVKIEITKLTTPFWTTLNASVPNVGSWIWDVPLSQDTSTYYYVRITDTATSSHTIESDTFQVAQGDLVNFQAPIHTDTWFVGQTYTIQWATMGTVTMVSLDFTSCWTCDWITVAHNLQNTGSYVWTVPETAEIRDTTIIRLTDVTPNGAGEELQSPQFRVRASSAHSWQPSFSMILAMMCLFTSYVWC